MELLCCPISCVQGQRCPDALIFLDLRYQVSVIGKHRGELAWRQRQQRRQDAWDSPRQPAMHDRNHELNMPHPLTTYATRANFDPTGFTDKPRRTRVEILSTETGPVVRRTKDALAKESPWLRLVGLIVDRIRFRHLTRTPRADLLWGCQADAHSCDGIEIAHKVLFFLFARNGDRRKGCLWWPGNTINRERAGDRGNLLGRGRIKDHRAIENAVVIPDEGGRSGKRCPGDGDV